MQDILVYIEVFLSGETIVWYRYNVLINPNREENGILFPVLFGSIKNWPDSTGTSKNYNCINKY